MPDSTHIPEILPLYQLQEMVAFPYMIVTIFLKESERPLFEETINYSNLIGSVPLRLGENWQVTLPDELLDGLRVMCGTQNVQIVYA